MRIRRFGLNCYDERRSREGAKHTSCSSTAPPRTLRERVRTLLPTEISVLEQLPAPRSAPLPEALCKGSPFPRPPCSRNSLLGCARCARRNGRHQPQRLFAGQPAAVARRPRTARSVPLGDRARPLLAAREGPPTRSDLVDLLLSLPY